jgi:hypothetical protein
MNVRILPTKATSVEAHYQHWLKKHKGALIETTMWERDANDPTIDEDEVMVRAAVNGDDAQGVYYFAVKKHRYAQREEFGYIIQNEDLQLELK